MNIARQITLLAVIPAIIALAIEGGLSAYEASKTLRHEAEIRLEAVDEIRREEFELYLNSIRADLSLYASSLQTQEALTEFSDSWEVVAITGETPEAYLKRLYIDENPNPTGEKEKLDNAGDGSLYSEMHARFHPDFRRLQQERGYYDVFLFNANGDLIYSVFKEADYATNMNSGEWKDTDLANAFRAAIEKADPTDHVFFDFRPYAPSANAPASFIAAPIVFNGGTQGVLAFQMPVDRISTILSSQIGLGTTGETLVVGADLLARNDTQLNPESILTRTVDNEAVRRGLAGEKGILEIEMDGKTFLSFYEHTTFLGTDYAFIVVEQLDEIFEPLKSLLTTIAIETVIIGLLAALVGIYFGRRLAAPIQRLTAIQTGLAAGDLEVEVPTITSPSELGELCQATEKLRQNSAEADRLRREQEQADARQAEERKALIESLASSFGSSIGGALEMLSAQADQLASVSGQLAKRSDSSGSRSLNVAEAAIHTSDQVGSLAESGKEMKSTIQEIASRVSETTTSMKEVVREVDDAAQRIESLQQAAQQIGSVVQMITDIAGQTNLLALNATIEAARAGDAGKGFAVVAAEVKNLSTQTEKATAQIGDEIQAIQTQTSSAVESIRKIDGSIKDADEVVSAIAAAVEEQSATSSQISDSMVTISDAADTVTEEISFVCQSAASSSGASIKVLWACDDIAKVRETLKTSSDEFLEVLRSDGAKA